MPVDLEFPVGYRLPGSYFVSDLAHATALGKARVMGGPERVTNGAAAVAAVLLDVERIAADYSPYASRRG